MDLSLLYQSSPLNNAPNSLQVFVHGDELDNYFKEFDADILPSDFDGKAPVADFQGIATKIFGSEDTALWKNISSFFNPRVEAFTQDVVCDQIRGL